MSFLLNLFRPKAKEVSITFCGLDNAGKTSIVKYLETGTFVETTPTMGINRCETINYRNLEINIYDLGGQEDFRALWEEANESSNGIVFVIDSTDYLRKETTLQVLQKVVSSQLHDDVTILVLLHKSDIEDRMQKAEVIDEFSLIDLPYKWAIYETSAKTGENIVDSFAWFFKTIQEEVN